MKLIKNYWLLSLQCSLSLHLILQEKSFLRSKYVRCWRFLKIKARRRHKTRSTTGYVKIRPRKTSASVPFDEVKNELRLAKPTSWRRWHYGEDCGFPLSLYPSISLCHSITTVHFAESLNCSSKSVVDQSECNSTIEFVFSMKIGPAQKLL